MKFEDKCDIERIKMLEEAVYEFAYFFSSDDRRHWELLALVDNEDFEEKGWMK